MKAKIRAGRAMKRTVAFLMLLALLMQCPAAPVAAASGVAAGDTVTFGSYEQDNNTKNGKEAIEWRVLAVKNDQALLIALHGLDTVAYGEAMNVSDYSVSGITWKTCALRDWLNGAFLSAAFSGDEQKQLVSTKVETKDAAGTVTTEDRVFVLSAAEADKYFSGSADMACTATPYAKSKLNIEQGGVTDAGHSSWWLRDMTSVYRQADRSNFMQTTFNEAGYVYGKNGTKLAKDGKGSPIFCDYLITVRPAVWVKTEALAGTAAKKGSLLSLAGKATPKPTVKATRKPTATPKPRATAKPRATTKPRSQYMSDRELIEMAKGYFALCGGSYDDISDATIEHHGDISYVYIAYYFHCYLVKVERKTGLALSLTKLF